MVHARTSIFSSLYQSYARSYIVGFVHGPLFFIMKSNFVNSITNVVHISSQTKSIFVLDFPDKFGHWDQITELPALVRTYVRMSMFYMKSLMDGWNLSLDEIGENCGANIMPMIVVDIKITGLKMWTARDHYLPTIRELCNFYEICSLLNLNIE